MVSLQVSCRIWRGWYFDWYRLQNPQIHLSCSGWNRTCSWTPRLEIQRKLECEFEENAKLFTYAELEKATRNFRADLKLGNGSFGTVYKGVLDDNTVVAIKKANNGNAPRIQQFLNEISILSKVSHKNLVKLLGCWKKRLQIATETAEALSYLHSAASPPIYHRDVKSSNILLDNDFTAKVADFGISKLVLPLGSTHISTALHGTPGYIDPQYQQNYQLTDKSDVYSMGVVLLELITGKMPVDFSRDSADKNLATFALGFIRKGMIEEIIDGKLEKDTDTVASIQRVANLAAKCLEFDRNIRPSMSFVLEALLDAKC